MPVRKDLQATIVETKHARQTVVNLENASMVFASAPQVTMERLAVAHAVRMGQKRQAQRYVSVNLGGLDHFAIANRVK